MDSNVTTHSMLTTFRRCRRMAMYKYEDRIRPKVLSRPLKMGGWFHTLLEDHYRGLDWRDRHQALIERQDDRFFDEEVGTVASDCERLMRSYLWHYQLEPKYGYKVLEAEARYETTWPDGSIYQCLIDALVEVNGEIWAKDHKLRSQLPDHMQRLLDSQSLLYLWALRRNKVPVKGFIWNYVRMKPPTIPQVLKNGTLSRRRIETDYVTLRRVIRENDIDPRLYAEELAKLRAVYWRPGKQQTSPFFSRVMMERDDPTILRMAKEMYRTKKIMDGYGFSDRDQVERTVDRSCRYMCGYSLLCSTELFGGNVDQIRRLNYQEGDPLDYYNRATGDTL